MTQMANGHAGLNGWRTESMYSFTEAARLANVSSSTVRNWLFGYTTQGRDVPPLFSEITVEYAEVASVEHRRVARPADDAVGDIHSPDEDMVSFLQMIEIMIAGRFRKSGLGRSLSFRKVREAYLYARETWGLQYPFAHLQLEALGGHIVHFLEKGGAASFQALDSPEQWTLPGLLADTIAQIDYDDDAELAARWWPINRTVPIVVDPKVSTGLPVIEGRGVTVQAIFRQWKAGSNIDFISQDFDMDPHTVETVLQYGDKIAA